MNALKARLNSFKYAFRGLLTLLQSEINAKIHLAATILVCAAGFYFELSKYEWIWIALAIALVWIAEALNTAIEKLCDLVEPNQSDYIKKIKDMAAGAVLIASIFALILGVIIFYSKF